ncbi:hypothetical protein PUNSTDRAFT_123106 [Punctularia strigosozonata HHB-11173 SS5]|uniref:Uncharacterized protein n=1 Tax=Punctularia strigosozonata (strain HHB-11173) TaxID=741275 RepID=R7S1U1_PUNST|nr:uncharacterized protein PUNSTDRAFT_123106 [Punctularia strigosozonata HHB-11173 SS5]EIN03824.1 hypothetical protein PUNSTDRAFT_123106 [Punctularia strigosozonata HHB-11173 SS5]
MGRPLFSKALYDYKPVTQPVVRTVAESQPAHPVYDRWAPDRFDPDSDEWFEGSNAVYEAFLDPHELEALRGEGARRISDSLMSELQVDGSSSGSDSGRTSPTGVDAEEPGPAPMEVDGPPAADRPVAADGGSDRSSVRGERAATVSEMVTTPQPTPPVATPVSTPPTVSAMPRVAPIPIPVPRSPVMSRAQIVPSTPPQNSLPQVTPSATPRIYTWRRPSITAMPVSPSGGPLTNPSARRSLAHITSVAARVPDLRA